MMRAMSSIELSIGELARATGLTPHTLRFYEAQGILRPAGRAPSGHRRYRETDIVWLEFVLRLKATGMPLAEIRRYAELRMLGETTVASRLTMLERHRARLAEELEALSRCSEALDDKIALYRRQLAALAAPRKKRKTA